MGESVWGGGIGCDDENDDDHDDDDEDDEDDDDGDEDDEDVLVLAVGSQERDESALSLFVEWLPYPLVDISHCVERMVYDVIVVYVDDLGGRVEV